MESDRLSSVCQLASGVAVPPRGSSSCSAPPVKRRAACVPASQHAELQRAAAGMLLLTVWQACARCLGGRTTDGGMVKRSALTGASGPDPAPRVGTPCCKPAKGCTRQPRAETGPGPAAGNQAGKQLPAAQAVASAHCPTNHTAIPGPWTPPTTHRSLLTVHCVLTFSIWNDRLGSASQARQAGTMAGTSAKQRAAGGMREGRGRCPAGWGTPTAITQADRQGACRRGRFERGVVPHWRWGRA